MTFDISLLCDYEKFESPESVGLGDGYSVSAYGSGKVKVNTRQNKGERVVCWTTDVLYVPKLANNLFSVHAGTSKGNTVLFRNRECCIRNKNGRVIGTGPITCRNTTPQERHSNNFTVRTDLLKVRINSVQAQFIGTEKDCSRNSWI